MMQCNAVAAAIFVGLLGLLLVCLTTAQEKGELNEPCQVFDQCRNFAYICGKNRTCQCKTYYRPNKYWDKCVGTIGRNCDYDEHCIEGAFCKDQKKCECKMHLVPNEDNTECSHSPRTIPTKYTILPVLVLVYLKLCLWID